jgi:alpha-N-acetylglucosamine transferase
MSRTMDMLNEVANKRANKFSLAVAKPSGRILHSLNEWLTKLVLVVIIMALLWSNLKYSTVIKEYSAENKESFAKLSSIEQILNENSRQMKISNDRIAEFKQQTDAQQFAISNLVKAKNTLYNQVNDLAAKLEATSSQEIAKQ